MQIKERSYSGKSFRPKPQYLIEDSLGLMVVSTAWGLPEIATRINHLLIDSLRQGLDEEITQVEIPIQPWSENVLHLKNTMELANDSILEIENKTSYEVIVESTIIFLRGSILSWAQVGGPHVFVNHSRGLQPIAYEYDWAWQLFQGSPLITGGLGLNKKCQINSGSIQLSKESFLILLERSYIPGTFFQTTIPDLSKLTQCLVADELEVPFWLGLVTF